MKGFSSNSCRMKTFDKSPSTAGLNRPYSLFYAMSSPKRPRVCTDFYRNTKIRTLSSKALKCSYGSEKKESISKRSQSKGTRKTRQNSRNLRKSGMERVHSKLCKSVSFQKPLDGPPCKLLKITAHFTSRYATLSNSQCYVKAAPDELLLQIFSFLQAADLCRVSQVCTRFSSICQDESLWRQLYTRVFDMTKPLTRTKDGLIITKDPVKVTCWKDSFRMLHNAHHVYHEKTTNNMYEENNNKHHKSLQEAINSATDNSFIMVHAGTYQESLIINKPVAIIGVAFGDVNAVQIESCVSTTMIFEMGADEALLGHLSIKHTVNPSSQYSKHGCIEITGECSPLIFHCKLTSLSHAGATVYVHGKGTRPVVSNCYISDSENVGIFVTEGAQGLYEDCEITNTKLAGVWVRSQANPIMRRNHVHHGRDVGFFIFDQGMGYYEKNDVHNNRIAGFEVRSWANPTVVGCSIHNGMTGGIYCHDDARGEFLENKIYSNKYAGIWITSQSNPTIKNNEIYDGQQGGIYVFGEGRGLIESNNIHDNALAGIQIRTKSNPIVRCNKIHSGLHGGIYIHEGGQGLIEENEIFSNTLAGVWITTGSSPTLRYNRIHSGKQVGVYFYDGGCGTLEENDIFNHKYSGIQIRSNSNPLIRRNKIWGGQNGGVLVYNEGMGLLEENEIFDNAMAGVWIKTDSNPVLRRNKIHDGREGGICIFNGGKGVLEENEIFRNTLTGVLISTSSFPVLKNNRVFDGGAAGIEITNNAGGVLEENEVFNNRFDGICLATGVKPKLKNNKVYGNRGEVKHAVDGGLCLFQVSGNSCYPMHDFYKCNTCGTSDGFAICVSCVNKCHEGHNVSFVRHDRFFCDCGAGSTGINCKLNNETLRPAASCTTRHAQRSCTTEVEQNGSELSQS